jgi:thiol-disulfide isomerase/thioredoxin
VFVDVGAYWCPPCRKLDEEVFIRPEVGEALARGFVAVHVDAEKGEGPELVARYRVQAYPTLLVLEAEGLEKGRMVDALAPAELLAGLEEIARGGDVLKRGSRRRSRRSRTTWRRATGWATRTRWRPGAPRRRPSWRVIAGDPDNARGLAAQAMVDRAAFLVAKQDGDPERAIALYRELQQKFPTAKESLRAYRQIGRELHKLGRDDEAVASLEAMVAAEPDDVDLKAAFGWFSFRERCRPEAGLRRSRRGSRSTRRGRAALPAGRAQASARRRRRGAGEHPRGGGARAGVGVLQAAAAALRGARGERSLMALAGLSAGTVAVALAMTPPLPLSRTRRSPGGITT